MPIIAFPLLVLFFFIASVVTIAAMLEKRPATRRSESVARGREMLERGEIEAARAVFESIVSNFADPGREAAFYWLGRTLEELGRSKEAEDLYRRYLEMFGTQAHPEMQKLVRERLRAIGASYWRRYNEALQITRASAEIAAARARFADDAAGRDADVDGKEAKPRDVAPEKVARDLASLATGQRVGDYVLSDKVGEGGFGAVWRALRPVAIKLARDPAAVEHLRRFGTIQSRVASERVVKPLEVNLEADPPYVVMEFVDGPTLRDVLRSRRLTSAEALVLAREIALGLADAHDQQVLHFDLKPENVLVGSDGKVKLTDFELGRVQAESAAARIAQSLASIERDQKLAGTLAYMSPEQREGKQLDARSDVYTFGVILFEALTGEKPQPGDRPSQFVKDLPAQVDAIFERCFARHERRYANARELANDLDRVVADLKEHVEIATLVSSAARAVEAPSPTPNPIPTPSPIPSPTPTPTRPPIDELMRRAQTDERPSAEPTEKPRLPQAEAG